jgi:hypothetical protein
VIHLAYAGLSSLYRESLVKSPGDLRPGALKKRHLCVGLARAFKRTGGWLATEPDLGIYGYPNNYRHRLLSKPVVAYDYVNDFIYLINHLSCTRLSKLI